MTVVAEDFWFLLQMQPIEIVLYPSSAPWPVRVGTFRLSWGTDIFRQTFEVPASVPAGACRLSIRVAGLPRPEVASTWFVVLPPASLTIKPWFGPPGSVVAAQGSGFQAGENVNLWLLDITGKRLTMLGTTSADGSGNLPSGASFLVPPSPPYAPEWLVTALGQSSGRSSPPVPFHFVAPLSAHLSYLGYPPTARYLEPEVFGFQPHETVDFSLTDASGTVLSIGSASLDNDGEISGPSVYVDDHSASPGAYTFTATGRSSGLTASSPFYVLAPPALSPNPVVAGFPLTLSVDGPPGSQFFVLVDSATPQVAGQWTNSMGHAQVTFSAPNLLTANTCVVASESPPPWGSWTTGAPLTILGPMPVL